MVDETAIWTNMTRTHGRAPVGERLVEPVPHAHRRTTTVIGAMDLSGIRASMVMEGAMDREAFELFLEQVLVPTLRPGEVVVMDNLSSHKGGRVKKLIRSAGCRLVYLPPYLPPYSPDLSPIEPGFGKFKTLLRKLRPRSVAELWERAGQVLNQITHGDAHGFFRHCGYTLQMD